MLFSHVQTFSVVRLWARKSIFRWMRMWLCDSYVRWRIDRGKKIVRSNCIYTTSQSTTAVLSHAHCYNISTRTLYAIHIVYALISSSSQMPRFHPKHDFFFLSWFDFSSISIYFSVIIFYWINEIEVSSVHFIEKKKLFCNGHEQKEIWTKIRESEIVNIIVIKNSVGLFILLMYWKSTWNNFW